MFSTPILDVAIGLSFFYLLLGLICSTVNEMIAAKLKTRSKFLDQGIDRLLGGDAKLKSQLYQHPMISALAPSDLQHCPSYIPAEKFATALLDIVSGKDKPLTDVVALREGVREIGTPALQTSLKALMDSSPDAAALKKNVEEWFNDSMDRVSGWYKRNAQRNTLLLACAVTLVLNADTINVAHVLWTNPSMRAAVVDEARLRAAKRPPDESLPMVEYRNSNDATASTPVNVPSSPEEALSSNEQKLLGQLTGWGPDWEKLGAASDLAAWLAALWLIIYNHGIGWIVTALAVSLGAPFWFDTLNRFMNIRNAGRAPDEPRDKSSATQQLSNA
ncbi:MAG: hypothetical protein WB579_10010 [Bryobacteraceae bacterium]